VVQGSLIYEGAFLAFIKGSKKGIVDWGELLETYDPNRNFVKEEPRPKGGPTSGHKSYVFFFVQFKWLKM